MFLYSTVLCVIGAIWFIYGWRFLGNAGKRPFKEGVVAEKIEEKISLLLQAWIRREFGLLYLYHSSL